MFICKTCLKNNYKNAGIVSQKHRGPCESCKKISLCYDIPSYQLQPLVAYKAPTMTLDEFEKMYHNSSKSWDFGLFKISCSKCGSYKVEFAGDIELDDGWYPGEESIRGGLIIKCHDCGNAMTINHYKLEP